MEKVKSMTQQKNHEIATQENQNLLPIKNMIMENQEKLVSTYQDLKSHSKSQNTLKNYSKALRRFSKWLAEINPQARIEDVTDEILAIYITSIAQEGMATSTANMAIHAIRFYFVSQGKISPVKEKTKVAMEGFKRLYNERGRGQSHGLTLGQYEALMTIAGTPKKRGRGKGQETQDKKHQRSLIDTVILGLLFQSGLRRSEAIQVKWADLETSTQPHVLLVLVRKSKTDQKGDKKDVRVLKGQSVQAIQKLKELINPKEEDSVLNLSAQSINRRIKDLCSLAGLKGYTSHSGRIGLASELTRRGASVQEVMKAGGWKTEKMVAHYSSSVEAEKGAVVKYL